MAGITLYKSLQVTDGVSITSAPTKAREGGILVIIVLKSLQFWRAKGWSYGAR